MAGPLCHSMTRALLAAGILLSSFPRFAALTGTILQEDASGARHADIRDDVKRIIGRIQDNTNFEQLRASSAKLVESASEKVSEAKLSLHRLAHGLVRDAKAKVRAKAAGHGPVSVPSLELAQGTGGLHAQGTSEESASKEGVAKDLAALKDLATSVVKDAVGAVTDAIADAEIAQAGAPASFLALDTSRESGRDEVTAETSSDIERDLKKFVALAVHGVVRATNAKVQARLEKLPKAGVDEARAPTSLLAIDSSSHQDGIFNDLFQLGSNTLRDLAKLTSDVKTGFVEDTQAKVREKLGQAPTSSEDGAPKDVARKDHDHKHDLFSNLVHLTSDVTKGMYDSVTDAVADAEAAKARTPASFLALGAFYRDTNISRAVARDFVKDAWEQLTDNLAEMEVARIDAGAAPASFLAMDGSTQQEGVFNDLLTLGSNTLRDLAKLTSDVKTGFYEDTQAKVRAKKGEAPLIIEDSDPKEDAHKDHEHKHDLFSNIMHLTTDITKGMYDSVTDAVADAEVSRSQTPASFLAVQANTKEDPRADGLTGSSIS